MKAPSGREIIAVVEAGNRRPWTFRLDAFNVFNHAQFFGPISVDGNISSTTFGQVVSAAPPRLMQAAVKVNF
jgi:hypothetical protein